MEAKELALKIAEVALDKQAHALEIINVRGKVDYTDYIVICSGHSERHVEALVSAVEGSLRKEGIHTLGIEGRESNHWVLMDFNDAILHVFEDTRRGFYDLDSLWIDAERIPMRDVASV